MDGMTLQSCGAMGVEAMKSTFEHDMAGIGWYTGEQCRKQMVIDYFSGTLMYFSLHGEKNVKRRYGEGLI